MLINVRLYTGLDGIHYCKMFIYGLISSNWNSWNIVVGTRKYLIQHTWDFEKQKCIGPSLSDQQPRPSNSPTIIPTTKPYKNNPSTSTSVIRLFPKEAEITEQDDYSGNNAYSQAQKRKQIKKKRRRFRDA